MTITPRIARKLGTMVAYGFARGDVSRDLALARRMRVSVLEILPDWRNFPDPAALRLQVADAGLAIHSAHGCWGGQSIAARRVDLADTATAARVESVDDLRRCVDWLADAGGTMLVVHPGGLSDREEADARRACLVESLATLADHASGTGIILCVENMPPGVHPGSRMADLAAIVAGLDRPEVGLALDTGHAHLVDTPASETRSAGPLLRTTHVHDNNGRQDVHLPPGHGTIDWAAWVESLDEIDYAGPVMLECIRYIRDNSDCLTPSFLDMLAAMAGTG